MKYLIFYKLSSILFLVVSVLLVRGTITTIDFEIIIMYSLFMVGLLLYQRPTECYKEKLLKRRENDK